MNQEQRLAQRRRNNEFDDWRRKANKGIPQLAARVFALREKSLSHDLERRLGYVIKELNNYDPIDPGDSYHNGENAVMNQILLQTALEGLYEHVKEKENT